VYSRIRGSAAAPTAGLHFTEDLLHRLDRAGIGRACVTLHVGLGTFRPVDSDDIRKHHMHEEKLEVSQACVNSILECRQRGGRVIAVGTTSARAIESAASFSEDGGLEAYTGRTSIFIYPGYEWKVIKGMGKLAVHMQVQY